MIKVFVYHNQEIITDEKFKGYKEYMAHLRSEYYRIKGILRERRSNGRKAKV